MINVLRVWDGSKFIYMGFAVSPDGLAIIDKPTGVYKYTSNVDMYTGKTDLDCVTPIYGNDIVELRYARQTEGFGRYLVVFEQGSFVLKQLEKNWLLGEHLTLPIRDFNIMKVIGNAYGQT